MNNAGRFLVVAAIALVCNAVPASAQIYVRIRPVATVSLRTEQPSPRHVWVDDEWVEHEGRYEHRDGYWATPPQEGYHYNPGHWEESDRGHRWHQGGWRGGERRREHEEHHDQGRHEGHRDGDRK